MNANNELTEATFVSLVAGIAERSGCKVVEIDFEKRVLNLDGPDEAVTNCARAIAEALG